MPYSMKNGEDLPAIGINRTTGQTIYGTPPDLPPRIDRACKPNGLVIPTSPIRNGSSAKNSSIHSIATLGRSSQDRLFSPSKMTAEENDHDEYVSRNQLIATKRMASSSVERNPTGLKLGNESYDSVSSYDSYNASAAQSMRMGPNTPDDLKSAPSSGGGGQGQADYIMNSPSKAQMGQHSSIDYNRPPGGSHHAELSRSPSSGTNDLNRTSYLSANGHPPAGGMAQRPTNLVQMLPFEAKTDYGKYR